MTTWPMEKDPAAMSMMIGASFSVGTPTAIGLV
jgi:hypothetical protein